MCEYCVNGWVQTIKFFVTTENPEKIDLKCTGEPGKAKPTPYEFGERCICADAAHNGSTDYVFQKSMIGNHLKLVASNPMIFVDDRIFYRDINNNQTKLLRNKVLGEQQIAKLLGDRYSFTRKVG